MTSTTIARLAVVAATLCLVAAAASAKTLVYCSEAAPEGFTPMVVESNSTMDAVAETLFDRLVRFKPGGTEVSPALATSWDVSADGTSYVFHLRPGVAFHGDGSFHPTRPLNADDVVYTFVRQLKADSPYHALSGGSYPYFAALGLDHSLKAVERIDDNTVRFILGAPDATFLATIALDFASIMSKEQADAMIAAGAPQRIDQEPVGTGPFVLTSYVQDATIRYRPNPDYWDGAPKLDALVFSITRDPTVRVAKLQAGECQIATQPPLSSIASLKADPNIRLVTAQGQNVGVLGFNVQKPLLADPRVRQALALAMDRAKIVDAVFQGAGTLAKTFVPPNEWGSAQDLPQIPYDPARAKALLAEAGHPDGFAITLWAMPVSRPYNPAARRMAELIQSDWAAVGVKAEIVSYEWASYLKRTQHGEQDAFLLGGTSDNGDPDNLLSYMFACSGADDGSNRSRWCDRPFDDLLNRARRLTTPAERGPLYVRAQQILRDQMPAVPMAHSIVTMPMRTDVQGYVLDPFGRQNFTRVTLAP